MTPRSARRTARSGRRRALARVVGGVAVSWQGSGAVGFGELKAKHRRLMNGAAHAGGGCSLRTGWRWVAGMEDLLRVAAVLALVAANAFFVVGEYAVVTARRASFSGAAQRGSRRAAAVLRLMDDPVRVIS